MTWREFTIYVKADEARELKMTRLVRAISYQVYCSYPKEKGQKNVSMEKYWPLPGDVQPDRGQPISEQDVLRAIKLYSNNGNGNPTA